MKTLVIPDLHHRLAWVEGTVAREQPDRVIFLGDGPDAGGRIGRGYTAVDTLAAFVRTWLSRPDVVWLIGNHEAHYIFNHESIRGGGWKYWRWKRYKEELGLAWWSRMRLAHWEQGWLLSHAGFRPGLAHPVHGFAPGWLVPYEREVFASAQLAPHSWIAIGDARLRSPKGAKAGVTWLDWDSEFQPIDGVNQLVGHTYAAEPRWKNTVGSKNLCLDSGCHHYGIIEDGEVSVRNVTP